RARLNSPAVTVRSEGEAGQAPTRPILSRSDPVCHAEIWTPVRRRIGRGGPGGSPMRHVLRIAGRTCIPALVFVFALDAARPAPAGVTREEVERAIRDGVRYLKSQQRDDGSWPDVEGEARSGTTSLVTLAMLTAGEKIDSEAVRKSL